MPDMPVWLEDLLRTPLNDDQIAKLMESRCVRELVDAAKGELPIYTLRAPRSLVPAGSGDSIDSTSWEMGDAFGLDPLLGWYGVSDPGDKTALDLFAAHTIASRTDPRLGLLYDLQADLRFCPNAPVILAMTPQADLRFCPNAPVILAMTRDDVCLLVGMTCVC